MTTSVFTPCQEAYMRAHNKMIAEFSAVIPQNDCPSNHVSSPLHNGMTERVRELMAEHLADGHRCECI